MRRHPLDLLSLVPGASFLLVAVLFLLDDTGAVTLDLSVVGPAALIAVGLLGLTGSLRPRGRTAAPGD